MVSKNGYIYKLAFFEGIKKFFGFDDSVGEGIAIPSSETNISYSNPKVQDAFDKIVTIDDILSKIENDNEMSESDKNKAKKEIIYMDKVQKGVSSSNGMGASIAGYGGSLLLSHLLTKNINVPWWLKTLISGAIIIGGGSIFSNVINRISSRNKNTQENIDLNKWNMI